MIARVLSFAAALALVAAPIAHAAPSPEPAGGVLSVGERDPLAFLFVAPTGKAGSTTSSEHIRVLSALVTEHTDLALAPLDSALVADCRGRLACFARKVSAERTADVAPRLLLVVSSLPAGPGADRLSLVLVDLERAEAVDRDATRTEDGWEDELEARTAEAAILARPRTVTVEGEDAARRALEASFTTELREALERVGRWAPYGVIELVTERAGLAIELDGATIGITRAGSTRITGVRPGRRALRLTGPRLAPWTSQVDVERGRDARVTPTLTLEGTTPIAARGLFWTGVGATLAGAAITTVALAAHDGGVELLCVGTQAERCTTGRAFQTVGYAPGDAPAFTDANPPGLLVGPLGYSLAAAGVTWALSSLWFHDPERFPWLELVVGAALGAAVYGTSAALGSP
ncbi:hypothetical protein L6R52_37020 [Myxococcota bacterium]|nr:hypothetical protein [Myxococcota bacterium]